MLICGSTIQFELELDPHEAELLTQNMWFDKKKLYNERFSYEIYFTQTFCKGVSEKKMFLNRKLSLGVNCFTDKK